jgi:enoyl-CoA hydratase
MYQNLSTSLENKILTITINRESKLNALNIQTLDELHRNIAQAFKNPEVGGIIITGAGIKAFAAGADISELNNLDEFGAYNLAETGHSKVFNLIENGNKPVIAAINGYALGGGLELALACHIRIASENAQLGFPEVSLGLIPGYGGTQRLPRLIGSGRAFEMILSGDPIDAASAYEMGLVNRVVPMEFLLSSATVLLQKILSRSPMAVSAAIRAINSSDYQEGYSTEISEFSKCFQTSEFKEGASAFLEKRPPDFKKSKE